ncbi:MAG: hypothetical protein AABX65_01535, partial [Nanoarchaeota archaeon]
MNDYTRRQFLKQTGKVLSGSSLLGLIFSSDNLINAQDEGHKIGRAYNIQVEDLKHFFSQDKIHIILNGQNLDIKIDEVLKRLLELDIESLRGKKYDTDKNEVV